MSCKLQNYLYIEAGVKVGLHEYMLSFVEEMDDRKHLLKLDPAAKIVEKIESRRGMKYVREQWDGKTRLMAARGDLYVEMRKPHEVIDAVEAILGKDRDAIAASRIFPSLAEGYMPSCQDIGDVDNLLRMGYRTVMLGDDVCQKRESVLSALNLLEAMAERYE